MSLQTARVRVRAVRRFAKYSSIGVLTFLFDLALLSGMTAWFHWDPVVAAGIAFLIAVSLNYLLSRRFVFQGTGRAIHTGYAIFLLITGIGAGTVMGLMALFVHALHWPALPSRVLIAGIVGVWNYLMNLYVNFRVAGK